MKGLCTQLQTDTVQEAVGQCRTCEPKSELNGVMGAPALLGVFAVLGLVSVTSVLVEQVGKGSRGSPGTDRWHMGPRKGGKAIKANSEEHGTLDLKVVSSSPTVPKNTSFKNKYIKQHEKQGKKVEKRKMGPSGIEV